MKISSITSVALMSISLIVVLIEYIEWLGVANGQHLQVEQPLFNKNYKHSDISTSCEEITIKQYDGIVRSGYLNVGIHNSTSSLAFIFYGAKATQYHQIYKKPTIIWLNGGPGCTSQFGNFFEIGPLHLNMKQDFLNDPRLFTFASLDDADLFYFSENKHAWTNEYNVLFIDQPISTGISYAEREKDIPVNQDQIAEQFYFALTELYTSPNGCFTQLGMLGNAEQLQTPSPLFIFGESYAGKYIPSIAYKILKEGNKFNLKSIGIGDAFTAPEIILQTIPDYALQNNLINESEYLDSLLAAQDVLDAMNDPSREGDARSLFWRFLQISNPLDVDVYNIKRQKGEVNDGITLETYMNAEDNGMRRDYKLFQMLPNELKIYKRCDKAVQKAMALDFMRNDCLLKVEYLLNQGLDITLYNGDLDMLVPYTAPIQWIHALTHWQHLSHFIQAKVYSWKLADIIVGNYQTYKNLSLYIIYNSGHMVPEDQPEVSINLINQTVKRALKNSNNKDNLTNQKE